MIKKPKISKKEPLKYSRGRPFDANGIVTRTNIINAARTCFAQQGYAAATNKMIANAAGLSASALYNYFPSKADIYCAVIEDGEAYIAEAHHKAIENIPSPLAAICCILNVNRRLHIERPDFSAFFGHIRSETSRNPELAHYLKNRESGTETLFLPLIKQAQDKGEISCILPAENIEMMLVGCMLGLSSFSLQISDEEHQKNLQAFQLLIAGTLITPINN